MWNAGWYDNDDPYPYSVMLGTDSMGLDNYKLGSQILEKLIGKEPTATNVDNFFDSLTYPQSVKVVTYGEFVVDFKII